MLFVRILDLVSASQFNRNLETANTVIYLTECLRREKTTTKKCRNEGKLFSKAKIKEGENKARNKVKINGKMNKAR